MESEKLYFVAKVELISGSEHYIQTSDKTAKKIEAEQWLSELKEERPFHEFCLLSIEC